LTLLRDTGHPLRAKVCHDTPGASQETQTNGWPDGLGTVYFRGRKLRGKKIKLPENFRGIVASRPAKQAQQIPRTDFLTLDGEAGAQQANKTEAMKVSAEFDEITLWGHEVLVDVEEDPYVRGLEEWLQVADQVRMQNHWNRSTVD
jgi:ribonuclease H2 subunit C